ncbi:unnamed protein product [Pieris macdunnoughi]|uniref:RNase H type-1 domain-containing protein n=1 Tax=Pieris macdunnoughi TaxID=345717 RepID=A0A821QXW5_9NEOP|nr:unnamed protein product [Pieris macdunnoughi]
MLITNKIKFDTPRLHMAGTNIEMAKSIKILGLTIDKKLTFNAHITNTMQKTIDLFKRIDKAAKDIEVERRVPYTESLHPAKILNIGFELLPDEENLSKVAAEIKIYTDGSKIDGKTGAAFVATDGQSGEETMKKKLKLADHCSVYQAELLAVNAALGETEKQKTETTAILSDLRSALEAITSERSNNRLATEARNKIGKIRENGKMVNLYWVKANAGLQGNEAVDEAAKAAACHLKIKPHYSKCPISYIKRGELRKQKMFTKPIQDSETATEDSYEISRMIAKRSRPFNDGVL